VTTTEPDPKPSRPQKGVMCARTWESAQEGMNLLCDMAGVPHTPVDRSWFVMTPRSMNGIRGLWVPNLVVLYDIEDDRVFPQMYETLLPVLDCPRGEQARIYRLNPVRAFGL